MSQSDDQTLEQEKEPTEKPATEEAEFDFEADEDRLSLYDKLDQANKGRRSAAEAEGFLFGADEAALDDEEVADQPSEDVDEEPVEEQERSEETKEPTLEGKVLSREEFEELFKDIKIKTKVAGEDVEAPVSEFLKATGLEKHYTKRLQELSRREQEILKGREGDDQGPAEGPSEDEIEEKYNELYEDSPYKAQRYLEEVNSQRSSSQGKSEQARVNKAVDDFKSVYPECTPAEWDKMNDPSFWQSHEDIVKLKDSGDIFATLVTAYTRLQTAQVKTDALADAKKAKEKPVVQNKTERKKQGQVLRTTVKTQKAQPKKGFHLESKEDYIASLRRQARTRMGIED
jgi:hypothetical protein